MPWDSAKQATFFPQPIGLAATWDTELMHDVASVISEEMRAINNEQYKQDKTYRFDSCAATHGHSRGIVCLHAAALYGVTYDQPAFGAAVLC